MSKDKQAKSVTWVEEIVDNLQSQYDTDGITHEDSGDAMIYLREAISAIQETARNYIAPAVSPGLVKAAFEWIESAPHGDDCFVSNNYEGDPGNRCNCGKDSILNAYKRIVEEQICGVLGFFPDNLKQAWISAQELAWKCDDLGVDWHEFIIPRLNLIASAIASKQNQFITLTDHEIEITWQFLHDEEGNPPDHCDFAKAIIFDNDKKRSTQL